MQEKNEESLYKSVVFRYIIDLIECAHCIHYCIFGRINLLLTKKGEHNLKYLTAFQHNNRQRRGFSLGEMLIVIAILAILMALLIPDLVRTQRELRQKELDAKAEILYVAAQNELTKLRAGGNSNAYGANLAADVSNPYMKTIGGEKVYLLSSKGIKGGISAGNWMANTADLELLGNYWVVIFDPDNASVKEVYYSTTNDINKMRGDDAEADGAFLSWNGKDRSDWASKDIGKVGWYGGGKTSATGTITETITLHLDPVNGEKLTVKMSASSVASISKFTLTIKDESDVTCTKDFDASSFDDDGTVTIVLDAVDDPFCTNSDWVANGGTHLAPGKLTLTLDAEAYPGKSVKFEPDTRKINSLFADNSTTDTAYIECGRHLQNLDSDHSQVPSSVQYALQKNEISFMPDSSWGKYYDDRSFKPIVNDYLLEYNGQRQRIIGMRAESYNAGLFGTFYGTYLSNIVLVDTSAFGSVSAGALVGCVASDCTIDGCDVYLDSLTTGMSVDSYKIVGASAGGLVGTNNGELTIHNSFAATTVGSMDATNVGGLVGLSVSGLELKHSYADCYLGAAYTGGYVGGLVGNAASESSITNCYAAGFLNTPAQYAHVMLNGPASQPAPDGSSSIKSSYSILDLSVMGTDNSDIYYNKEGKVASISSSMSKAELQTKLGSSQWYTKSAAAVPYNLDGMGRENAYTFPGLTAPNYPVSREETDLFDSTHSMLHYGDWKVSFQPGSLVYYEVYTDGSCGFSGAGVSSTLKDSNLVGDGYGIVFRKNTATELSVKVYNFSTDDDKPDVTQEHLRQNGLVSGSYKRTDSSGSTTIAGNVLSLSIGESVYYVYPLDKATVNAEPNGFWQKAVINFKLKGSEEKELVYYFNPLLADVKHQQLDADVTTLPSFPRQIFMRSPRQLNALSDYYSNKWSSLSCLFTQQRTIDYTPYNPGNNYGYKWDTYSLKPWTIGNLPKQAPIGREAVPFQCAYDGNCLPITGLHIDGATAYSVGLFGTTEGWMQNIVFAANVSADSGEPYYYVRRNNIPEGATVYMGTLIGHNRGTVVNCAVAGYQMAGTNGTKIYTYNNSTLQIGGLVGRNDGTISNCSAVFPAVSLNGLYSNIALGGLVGRNNRTVLDCYAIGYLAAEAKESAVNVAGFAGANMGSISNSYCAVSTFTSGSSVSYAFAPLTGPSPTNSYFLHNGTYLYLGELRAFSSLDNENGAIGINYMDLMDQRGTAWVSSYNTRYDAWVKENATFDESGAYYPFRGVVTNGLGYAHYGDWPAAPMMGDYGVFYWEHEENGTNDGYHFSFLGVKENDGGNPTLTRGSTLCTAHDDHGVITEYGYGYYSAKELDVTATWNKVNGQDAAFWGQDTGEDSQSSKAKADLERQIAGYNFIPYVTGYSAAKTGDYLYLEGERTSATLTLTERDHSETPRTYCLSPFFGNAFSRVLAEGETAPQDKDPYKYEWAAPGSADNSYMIRAIKQLQFINWNYVDHNVDSKVEKAWKTRFPYLQYYTLTEGRQGRDEACGPNSPRPVQYWVQSHDLRGDQVTNYAPIAGMATSSPPGGNGTNPVYVWFGGSYDGRSYKIQNLPIDSTSYTVGVFGVTIGATIKNIILYGNGDTVPNPYERITHKDGVVLDTIPVAHIIRNSKKDETGAYFIGGLIGLAYDYDVTNTTNTITNCAVAGYDIIDLSYNQNGKGYGNIGGLIGVSQVKLRNCSAVVDIRECFQTRNKQYSSWGNEARIGGLAGAGLGLIENCYTGGSVEVAQATLYEWPKNYDENNPTGTLLSREQALHIFVAGIMSCCYQHDVSNFSGQGMKTDGIVDLKNCYTYMDLPDIEGNVRAVSVLAGTADRFHRATTINVSNCYYQKSTYEGIDYEWPGYYFKLQNSGSDDPRFKKINKDSTTFNYNGEFEGLKGADLLEEIKMGNLDSLCLVMVNQIDKPFPAYINPDPEEQTPLDFEQLSGLETFTRAKDSTPVNIYQTLVSPWGHVTVTEGEDEANVSGKYSFSSLPSQDGQNYPFPAVLRQVDDDEDEPDPFVHYGRWSIFGTYWAEGRTSMDIFEELAKTENPDEAWAEKELTLYLDVAHGVTEETEPDENGNCGNVRFTVKSGEDTEDADAARVAKIVSVKPEDSSTLKVRLRALKTGTATLTAKIGQEEASCSVSITAALKVDPSPSKIVLTGEVSDEITCEATAEKGKPLPAADSEGGTEGETEGSEGAGETEENPNVFGNYTRNANGKWTVMPETDKDNKSLLSVYKKAENTENPWVLADFVFDETAETEEEKVKTVSEGEKLQTKDNLPIQSVVINGNSFKVDKKDPGGCYVTVTYTYDYHSSEGGGTLSASAVVQVRKMGFAGLMNAEKSVPLNTLKWYDVMQRRLTNPDPDAGAEGETAADPVEVYQLLSESNQEKLVAPQGADLFLFGSAAENDLAELEQSVPDVKVLENGADVSGAYDVRFFTVKDAGGSEQKEILTADSFTIHGASVRIKSPAGGSDEPSIVSVTVRLKEPLSENLSEDPVYYPLTVDNVKAYPYELNFNTGAQEATGSMRPVGVGVGSTLPDAKPYFKRAGYMFTGWKIGTVDANGNVTVADDATLYDDFTLQLLADPEAGGEREEGKYYFSDFKAKAQNNKITLVAQWQEASYKVIFYPGAYPGSGSDNPVTLEFKYDGDTALPNPMETNPKMFTNVPENYVFLNWNTRRNGYGESYEAGVPVNLTEQNNATVLLYAQWDHTVQVVLDDGISSEHQELTFLVGSKKLDDNTYVPPTAEDMRLVGWDVNTTSGRQLLFDADGVLTDQDVTGYISEGAFVWTGGADAADALRLYAKWNHVIPVLLHDEDDDSASSQKFYAGDNTFVEPYTKPTPQGKRLICWEVKTENGRQMLFDADGKLTEQDVTGYIEDGLFVWSGGEGATLDLYAKWEHAIPVRLRDEISGVTYGQWFFVGESKFAGPYTAPTMTNGVLNGWYVDTAGGRQLLFDAEGVLTDQDVTGYVENGVFVWNGGENATLDLYAKWEFAIPVILHDGISSETSSQTFSPSGTSFALPYTAPTLTDWELDGWYVETTAGERKLLFDADGNITTENVAGYIEDGEFVAYDLTEIHLYARWRKDVYILEQVSALTSQDDNGSYLIASGTTGSVQLLGWKIGTDGKYSLENKANKEIKSGDGFLYMEALPDQANWKVTLATGKKDPSITGVNATKKDFGFQTNDAGQYYLRNDDGGLALKDIRGWTDGGNENTYSNRCLWLYEGENKLISQKKLSENKSVGYNNGWKVAVGNTCYLFRIAVGENEVAKQPIYAYNPY